MGIPRLLVFTASWCQPCQALKPYLSKFEKENEDQIVVVGIDVDANPELTEKYGIISIPTLILVIDNKEISRNTPQTPAITYLENLTWKT